MKLISTQKSSHLAFILGAALALTIALVASTSIYILHQRALNDWRNKIDNLTSILAANANQQMTTAQLALTSITDRVQAQPGLSAERLRNDWNHAAFFDLLKEKVKSSPQIDVMTLVAANGDVINFSRSFPAPAINLADRDYFKAHQANPALNTYISVPVRNKGNGKWVFYMSRRLNDSDGKMVGLVLLGVSCDYYQQFFKNVSLGEKTAINLVRDDFVTLARWPSIEVMIGKPNLTGITHSIIADMKLNKGVVVIRSPRIAQGGEIVSRMGAAQRVERFPLIISYILDEDIYLAEWRNTSVVIIVFSVASILILIFSFTLLYKTLQRRDADLQLTLDLKYEAEMANRASRESSDRMEAILKNAADAIITINQSYLIESFNKAAEAIYRAEEGELLGQPITIFTPSGAVISLESVIDTLDSQGKIAQELEQQRSDYSCFPAEILISEFFVAEQRKIIIIVRDITERKKMERIKSDFVSTVSHELRTPLTAIRGSLGLVMGGVGGVLPEKALTLIRMAHNSTERLTRLINDLLDVQKIEAGKFDYHFRIFALGKLINEAVEGNQAYAQRLQVAIELEGRVPDVALRVDGDRF
ncbi:MAG: hypothetical protein RL748_1865, partial [Pseudomonadota bacterium]